MPRNNSSEKGLVEFVVLIVLIPLCLFTLFPIILRLVFWLFDIVFTLFVTFMHLLMVPIRLVKMIIETIPWIATFGILYWLKKSGLKPLELYGFYFDCLIGWIHDMGEVFKLLMECVNGIFTDILHFVFDKLFNGLQA